GARALQHGVTLAGAAGEVRGNAVGAVGRARVLRQVDLAPGPVRPREVATQHPAVGETLVEGQRRALVLLLVVAVDERDAATGRHGRLEPVVSEGAGLAVGQG